MGDETRELLWVFELGGYSTPQQPAEAAGYRVCRVDSGRQAVRHIANSPPAALIAEFNYQPSFRDRTSNLESILAAIVRSGASTKVIVLHDPEHAASLEQLKRRFPHFTPLGHPFRPEQLTDLLGACRTLDESAAEAG